MPFQIKDHLLRYSNSLYMYICVTSLRERINKSRKRLRTIKSQLYKATFFRAAVVSFFFKGEGEFILVVHMREGNKYK